MAAWLQLWSQLKLEVKRAFIFSNCATWSLHQFFSKGGAFRCRWVRDVWFPLPHLEWSPDGIQWFTLRHPSLDPEANSLIKLVKILFRWDRTPPEQVEEFYIHIHELRTSPFPVLLTAMSVAFFVLWFFLTLPVWPMTKR